LAGYAVSARIGSSKEADDDRGWDRRRKHPARAEAAGDEAEVGREQSQANIPEDVQLNVAPNRVDEFGCVCM
jgi:hypothetical protein